MGEVALAKQGKGGAKTGLGDGEVAVECAVVDDGVRGGGGVRLVGVGGQDRVLTTKVEEGQC